MHGSIAGWSSLAARRAHNPKVAGSNPAPATNQIKGFRKEALFRLRICARSVPILCPRCTCGPCVLRVLIVLQAFKSIDWNTCVLVGAMIPLATAMRSTGAAELLADQVISIFRGLGPRAIIAGLVLVTFALTSVMSNVAAALVMLPIAVATGAERGMSPMAPVIAETVGAHAPLSPRPPRRSRSGLADTSLVLTGSMACQSVYGGWSSTPSSCRSAGGSNQGYGYENG